MPMHGEGQRTGDDPDPLRPGGGDRRDAGLHRGDPRGDPHAGRALGRQRDAGRALGRPPSRCSDGSWAWRRRSRCSPAPSAWTRRSRWRCERRGRWFDPPLVDGLRSLAEGRRLLGPGAGPLDPSATWPRSSPRIRSSWPTRRVSTTSRRAFARVIDAKSPYTYLHSERVAELAVTIGRRLHFERRPAARPPPRGAAARHRQARRLDPDPRQARPAHRARSARRSGCIRHIPSASWSGSARSPAIVEIASAHHERLDGKGYHLGLPAERLSPMSRALAVADVYEAIDRRPSLPRGCPRNEALAILRGQAGTALCARRRWRRWRPSWASA